MNLNSSKKLHCTKRGKNFEDDYLDRCEVIAFNDGLIIGINSQNYINLNRKYNSLLDLNKVISFF